MAPRPTVLLFCLALFACGDWPDPTLPPGGARDAPYPDLVPLSQILAAGPDAALPPSLPADRIAALRARAAALRGPVVDAATRARMRAGVDLSGLP